MNGTRTPGPWVWSDDGYGDECCPEEPGKRWLTIHTAGEGSEVAVIVNRIEEPTEEQKANAAFIVACENAMTAAGIVNPEAVQEIMDALIGTLRAYEALQRTRGVDPEIDLNVQMSRAALAKAKGGAA